MRRVEARFRPFKPTGKMDQAPDVPEPIDGDVLLIDADSGEPFGFQLTEMLDPERRAWMSRVLRFNLKWGDESPSFTSQARLSGIRYPLRTFGFTEPKPLRRRYGCAASMLYDDAPALAALLDEMAGENWKKIKELLPDIAAVHEDAMQVVHRDWWTGGAPWTSGIINKTAALAYHRDSGNVKATHSAMLTLRRHMDGGHLYFPEYDVALAVPDGSISSFSGQSLWHGVTPFHPTRHDAYRFTAVWYAKNGMKACGCRADEPKRAALLATEARDR